MKKIITLFILLLTIFCSAQNSDMTCIKTRWIAVKPIPENKSLFDSTLIYKIKELVDAKKIDIYNEDRKPSGKGEWYPIPEFMYEIDKETLDTNYVEKKSDYLEIRRQSDIPLIDEYGDPVEVTLEDGVTYFKYPPPTIYPITIRDLDEIRIREEKYLDSTSNQWLFKATGLSFCLINSHSHRELFWVNLDDLYKNCPSIESYKWFETLTNRDYYGFQYMQTSCYDKFIRY